MYSVYIEIQLNSLSHFRNRELHRSKTHLCIPPLNPRYILYCGQASTLTNLGHWPIGPVIFKTYWPGLKVYWTDIKTFYELAGKGDGKLLVNFPLQTSKIQKRCKYFYWIRKA